jgi:hypothetical protein
VRRSRWNKRTLIPPGEHQRLQPSNTKTFTTSIPPSAVFGSSMMSPRDLLETLDQLSYRRDAHDHVAIHSIGYSVNAREGRRRRHLMGGQPAPMIVPTSRTI